MLLHDVRAERDGRDRGVASERVVAKADRHAETLAKRRDRAKVLLLERRRIARHAVEQREGSAAGAAMDLDRGADLIERRHPGRHDGRQTGRSDRRHELVIRQLAAWQLH